MFDILFAEAIKTRQSNDWAILPAGEKPFVIVVKGYEKLWFDFLLIRPIACVDSLETHFGRLSQIYYQHGPGNT